MIKTLTVATSTFIVLSAAIGSTAHACDEDCAYEAQEAAYERAYEREEAREEAAEEGYDSARRSSGSARRRGQAAQGPSVKRSSAPLAAKRQTAEPKPDPTPRTQTPSPRIKVAKENSSISTGSGRRDVAEDDSYVQPAKAIGCKTYLPSVGMTLSVPCD